MAKRKAKRKAGYPALPPRKPGVKRALLGAVAGALGARKRAKEAGLSRKERRKAMLKGAASGSIVGRGIGAVQGFRANKGMGFKERLKGIGAGFVGGAGNNANSGLAERIQEGFGDRMDALRNPEPEPVPEEELDETMDMGAAGGVDTSAAGTGMDSGGNVAAQRGGALPDRRKRRKQRPKYAGQKRRVPPGDMPNPDARYESTRDRRRYKVTKKGLRTRKSAIRREKRKQRNSMK